jgi:L-aspartate oxidase
VLRDLDGTPLMAGHDPRGDLAPRDVVAARMAEVIGRGFANAGHVWLDATGLGRDLMENGFPTVTAACRKHGIDPVTEMIPVAPGAHYSCGGILADLDGRTSLPGLYAAGEAASTGVQGANRLASNSVTEAIIAGRRAGATIAGALSAAPASPPTAPGSMAGPAFTAPAASVAVPESASEPAGEGAGAAAQRFALAQAMSRYAGVMRDADGLARLLQAIAEAGSASGPMAAASTAGPEGAGERGSLDLEAVEAANLRVVSMLIAEGARRRAESRGCHRRRDAADTATAPWHTLARWDGYRLMVTKEAL